MATTTANHGQTPVTNGIPVASKATPGIPSVISTPEQSSQKAKAPGTGMMAGDYMHNQPTPPKNIPSSAPMKEDRATSAQAPSPNSQRRTGKNDIKQQKPAGKSQMVDTSMLAANSTGTQMQKQQPAGGSRPATPDFRYTVLADDDEDPQRKPIATPNVSNRATNGATLATNGNSFRSVSVDAGDRGQLSADMSTENVRRHSLSMSPVVSPSVSIDNASPSGSVSDLEPESLLVLDDQSGICSRRTSISSVDSNLDTSEGISRPTLMRALSSDSVDSTCSIVDLANNEQEIGQLETRLFYDGNSQYLHIWILQAYDIKPPVTSNAGGLVEFWVVVFLLPHQKPLYRTQLQPFAPVLQFHEQFRQRVQEQDLRKLAFLCQLYCRTRSSQETIGAALAAASSSATPSKKAGIAGSELIGQAKVRLKDVELKVANTLWLSLLPKLDNSSGDKQLGELLFSLSYLPTAERLTVVVAKARNIRTFDSVVPEKIMVRVYLVYGAKISKKKTSVKETVEGSAIFNESIIFSLSQNLVQKVYLRLSVVEPSSVKSAGDQRTIGHVTVGSRRTSKEFGHWQKMIEQPRKPVSMWHYLSPKSQKLT